MKNEKLTDPRRRKRLLVLPLLVLPFLTMAFWALGGGSGKGPSVRRQPGGLNLELPNAQLKEEKGENKLSFYEEAEKDSIKWREGMANDPFFRASFDSTQKYPTVNTPYPLQVDDYKDPNEEKVYQKLAQLNSQLQNNRDRHLNPARRMGAPFPLDNEPALDRGDVSRLEEMLTSASRPSTKDPEVDQLNNLVERILDIQHPERIKQKLADTGTTGQPIYPVETSAKSFSVSLLDTGRKEKEETHFYRLEESKEDPAGNAIEAVVHETQSLVEGSIIKLRLLRDIMIRGALIPRGNFVFGKTSLEGERLHIGVSSIRSGSSLYPVNLTVYDLDGMEGIHIPGAPAREVVRQSAGNSLQNLDMPFMDPSLKSRATSAGINAARTLLTRKARQVKVTVRAGYSILLREKSNQ